VVQVRKNIRNQSTYQNILLIVLSSLHMRWR